MDTGNHNCRDYYLNPTSTQDVLAARAARRAQETRPALPSRASQTSPLNLPAKRPEAFPFLQLPLELRRQVYSYLLPTTETTHDGSRCERRASMSALLGSIKQKRIPPTHHNFGQGPLPTFKPSPKSLADSIIWRRGNVSLLAVNKQLHEECAAQMYGEAAFVIFVTYDHITFRFRWILPTGLAPSLSHEFLELIPSHYLRFIRRLVVTVDHVDSYTGMIKYNVGGKGLTHGLRGQVARLVRAFRCRSAPTTTGYFLAPRRHGKEGEDAHSGIKRISIRLLNGNDYLDTEKREKVKAREASLREVADVQTVLEPFAALTGLVEVQISGAVSDDYVEGLQKRMMGSGTAAVDGDTYHDDELAQDMHSRMGLSSPSTPTPL